MPRIIGLTGNIASGKTTIGRFLLELGATKYIDADALVHRLYMPGQPVAEAVIQSFGNRIVAADGGIDRRILGGLVFQNAEALQRLEQIVHPAVSVAVRQELEKLDPKAIVILDAVKLLEGGSASLCQSKWLVICDRKQQLARLIARNQLSLQEAEARLQAQPDRTQHMALVDEIIDNSQGLDETRQQVEVAFAKFCQEFPA